MPYLSYILLFMTTGILSCAQENKTYYVKKIRGDLKANGEGDNPHWKNANELTDFIYPWEDEVPPLTSFKALHNQDWVYCLFVVRDDNINIYVDKDDKSEVGASDRVEIFFREDERLSPYYGLELDPRARIMDYKAEYHRKFDGNWSWPAGQLVVKTSQLKGGYIVEIAVSKLSLTQLGLLKDKQLQAGLYRGECVELIGKDAKIKWISWVIPNSKTPDFHIPSSFGILRLDD